MELDIEILWHTDESRKLYDSGIEVDSDELERKTITFYSVDVISPYKWDDEHMFCKITAGGETWIAAYEYEEVREMISKAKRLAIMTQRTKKIVFQGGPLDGTARRIKYDIYSYTHLEKVTSPKLEVDLDVISNIGVSMYKEYHYKKLNINGDIEIFKLVEDGNKDNNS